MSCPSAYTEATELEVEVQMGGVTDVPFPSQLFLSKHLEFNVSLCQRSDNPRVRLTIPI